MRTPSVASPRQSRFSKLAGMNGLCSPLMYNGSAMHTHALLITRDISQQTTLCRGCELSGRIDYATVVRDGQAALEFLLESTRQSNLRNQSLLAIVDMQSGEAIELLKFLGTTPSLQAIPVVALVPDDDDFMLVNASAANVHAVLSRSSDAPNVADVVAALVAAQTSGAIQEY